jgi:proton-translocating NADH-quinone oxidoreductase chain N
VPNLDNILIHFLPEIILTLGMLVVLIYDVTIRGRDGLQAWLAILSLVAAMLATVWLSLAHPGAHGIFEARSAVDGAIVRPGAFISDGFTHFFRLIGMVTVLLVLLSGQTFMRSRTPFKGEFYSLLLGVALAMNLMAGSNDLLMVALSIEFLSISSYILTAFLRHDPASTEAGLKYFLYGAITSAVMLFGMTFIYGATGTTTLTQAGAPAGVRSIASVVHNPDSMAVAGLQDILLPGIALLLAGLAFKIALVPFHQWSPDAYEGAPTPVTAFLSVGPKAAGFALLLRLLLTVFDNHVLVAGWLGLLGTLAFLTMVVGNLAALNQNNVKRMMAYSSIAQAGYMLVGLAAIGSGKLDGIDPIGSVLVFILAYVFTNLGAFAIIIAVDHAGGSAEVSAFKGLMRRSPFLAVSLAVFFLSLIGIPPLSGFIGKFAVFGTAVAAGHTSLALVGVLTGVISVVYYFKVIQAMFFAEPEDASPLRPAPMLAFVVAASLALTIFIGLAPGAFIKAANDAAAVIAPITVDLAAEH